MEEKEKEKKFLNEKKIERTKKEAGATPASLAERKFKKRKNYFNYERKKEEKEKPVCSEQYQTLFRIVLFKEKEFP